VDKLYFTGKLTSIQPRIRLTRSFDEASHTYLGYAIKIAGSIDDQQTTFSIGIGKEAQTKFSLGVCYRYVQFGRGRIILRHPLLEC
jgi:hypothetical protein